MSTADLKIDNATGDLSLANSDIELVYDDDTIRQRLKLRLQDVRGDWFRDTEYGTDWFGSILGKRSDLTRKAEIRRQALGTEGVASVRRLELTYTGRDLTIDLEVVRDEGGTIAVRFSELLGGA